MYEIFEALLREKGVTVSDVCRATGISNALISMWKKRRGTISADTAAKIADYFEVPVRFLLGETDSREDEMPGYYVFGETAEVAQHLFEQPGMRILFDAARDSRPEDLMLAAEMLRRMKGTNRDA